MIELWEENTVTHRYFSALGGEHHGVQTTGDDMEEWVGIRSQLLAQIQGWA